MFKLLSTKKLCQLLICFPLIKWFTVAIPQLHKKRAHKGLLQKNKTSVKLILLSGCCDIPRLVFSAIHKEQAHTHETSY